MSEISKIDLNIRGENVQELYTWYLEGRLVVNRRYQRKLVWTREEKEHLIDTLIQRFPLPLVLLAEVSMGGVPRFEIIDGMQRLNAIFSFIENQFAYKGEFFDLDTMASSKQLRDENKMVQRGPTLARQICAQVANYKIPISTYRIDKPNDIDEIFRRINSFGRVLSNQEIRQAGVTGTFADLVRTLSAEVRGDASHEEVLLLSSMHDISITNRDLDYGIKVEDIFWVRHGILIREDIRDSRDEELIADLVAYIISPEDDKPSSSRETLDEFYGRPRKSSEDALSRAADRKKSMDAFVSRYGSAILSKTILQTKDFIEALLGGKGGFRSLLDRVSPNYGTPRYFQSVFLALHDLLFAEKLKLADEQGLLNALEGLDQHVSITTGGNWGAPNRSKNIAVVKGLARKFFKANPNDPVALIGRTEFQNLLSKAKTEAASYDFKQGFHRLDDKRSFDDDAFTKVLQTICALANLGKGKIGYIVLGVADKKADSDRIRKLYGITPQKMGEFYVVGVDREATAFHTNMDKYLQLLSDKIARSTLSDEIRLRVGSSISPLDFGGHTAVVLRVESGSEPCFLGDQVFKRVGAQTVPVSPKEIIQLAKLFQ